MRGAEWRGEKNKVLWSGTGSVNHRACHREGRIWGGVSAVGARKRQEAI